VSSDQLASLVASSLDALIAIVAISGGLYLFWKSVQKGSMPYEYLIGIIALVLFAAAMIFVFTHFMKGK
jgi:pilus assembly protein TadC